MHPRLPFRFPSACRPTTETTQRQPEPPCASLSGQLLTIFIPLRSFDLCLSQTHSRYYTPPLSFKVHEQPSHNSSNLASASSSSSSITPCPLLPIPLSRCPSDIGHVIVLSNSIFPCSIACNTFHSMLTGGGNQSSHAKHHYRSSIRDNESWRAKFVLHSTHME